MSDPTKVSGSTARIIAEHFLEPLSSTPGEQIRQTLARAYLGVEAERDALREAGLHLDSVLTDYFGEPDDYGSLSLARAEFRVALERHP